MKLRTLVPPVSWVAATIIAAACSAAPRNGLEVRIEVIGAYRDADVRYLAKTVAGFFPDKLDTRSWSASGNRFTYHASPVAEIDGVVEKKHLGQITKLRTLYLDGTKITDAGMAHFSGLTELRSLNISNTSVTEKGLQHLSKATRLTSITATNSGVTHGAIQRFRKRAN